MSGADTCPATLPGPSHLTCQRTDPHQPHTGCIYVLPLLDDTRHADPPEDY